MTFHSGQVVDSQTSNPDSQSGEKSRHSRPQVATDRGGLLKFLSRAVVSDIEHFFFRWGCFVANHPFLVIVSTLCIIGLSCVGFIKFTLESRAEKLWTPTNSKYIANKAWLEANFRDDMRLHFALVKSERNILTKGSLLQILKVHRSVNSVSVNGSRFEDRCFKLPVTDLTLGPEGSSARSIGRRRRRRRRRQTDYEDDDYEIDWDFIESQAAKTLANSVDTDYEEESDFDSQSLTEDLPPQIYCDLISTLNYRCAEYSVLQIWNYNSTIIENLSDQDIIDDVNNVKKSPVFGNEIDYTELLGHKVYNKSGHVVAARAARLFWLTTFNETKHDNESSKVSLDFDPVDDATLDWEAAVIADLLRVQKEIGPNITLLMNVARSFGDITANTLFFDGIKLCLGYVLMFVYTVLMLGKLNYLEIRLYLTAVGIMAIGFSLLVAYGLGGLLGLSYTPIHAILPFLCLGIGIDDMFVIVQCWYNIPLEIRMKRPLPELVGLTMKHAGVAITVTSLTDVCVFFLGAATILPGLRSFCVTCAIAIGSTYLMQASWFVAWFTIDQWRIQAGRNAFIPCIKGTKPECVSTIEASKADDGKRSRGSLWIEDDAQSESSGRGSRVLMEMYASKLNTLSFKITIVTLAIAFGIGGIIGCTRMRQEFDPVLLLPADSYLRQWIEDSVSLFPSTGWEASVNVGGLELSLTEFKAMDSMVAELERVKADESFLTGVESWWRRLQTFIAVKHDIRDWQDMFNSTATEAGNVSQMISDFLYHVNGSKYQSWFHFDTDLQCNKPIGEIQAVKLAAVTYAHFQGPSEHIPARRAVDAIIDEAGFQNVAFSFSKIYAAWETDEVIGEELWRNLGLALISVFVITLILLANIKICLMIFLCVGLTLIDLVGFLHFWNVTIDVISCVNIVLAVGLCVDYSVHIAHGFMVAKGRQGERTKTSLVNIGPAVLNGGLTTLLALILLGFSQSHAFVVFFKVFLMTVFFGLFHGLALLPVMLSALVRDANVSPTSDDESEKSATSKDNRALETDHDDESSCSNNKSSGQAVVA